MAKSLVNKLATNQRKRWLTKLQQSAAKQDAGSPKTTKVVLDTNVWYSAMFYGGVCEQVIDLCLERYRLVLSDALEDEILVNLKLKHRAPHRWLRMIRQSIELSCEVIVVNELPPPITRDPKDEHVVVAAILAGATVIVSGDKDLLAVDGYQNIAIMQPASFLAAALPHRAQ